MALGTLLGLSTLLFMLTFIVILLWAYSGKRRQSFMQAAQLPLDEDAEYASIRHGESS
jgi:cytochrome c oxidase cbb3-type subunit 4